MVSIQSRAAGLLVHICSWFLLLNQSHHVIVNGLSTSSRNTQRRRRTTRPPPPPRAQSASISPDVAMLSKALRMIYNQGGTLAVLKQSDGMQDYKASELVQAAIQASRGDKGMTSGILNAFLGFCCNSNNPQMAVDVMEAYDDFDNNNLSSRLKPDLVALSLAYVATSQNKRFVDKADDFLTRAQLIHSSGQNSQDDKIERRTNKNSSMDWFELKQCYGIELLQEGEEFVVVSKPSGMVCYQASTKSQLNSKKRNRKRDQSDDASLEECLLNYNLPLSTLNRPGQGRGLVHRIDRGTSGCLVLAKTNRMHAILMSQFFLRNVCKSYQALVVSTKLLPKQGTIDLDIDGRPAKSTYTVIMQQKSSCLGGYTVARVKVETEQGRKHQVRIHCAQGLGAPILLDPLYGGQAVMSSKELQPQDQESLQELQSAKRFCLHADRLAIAEQGIRVEAPLPDWWQQLEQRLFFSTIY